MVDVDFSLEAKRRVKYLSRAMPSLFSARRLSAQRRSELLTNVTTAVRESKEKGVQPSVVFDLDGTILDNRPRVAVILRELAETWRERHPEAATSLAGVLAETIVYDTVANLKLLGVHDSELHAAAVSFWKARFFTDDYVKHDTAFPGSVTFVRQLYASGANIVYLTGRDLPKMAVGTFASLRDRGFPIGCVGTNLVTKPDFETPDAIFKQDVAASLRRAGRVVAVFDNEPANCNLLLEAHPGCVSILVDSHHAPNPPPLHENVHVIDTFES